MDDWSAEELERFRELMERANRELEERNEMSKETREELDTFKKSFQSASNTTSRAFKQLGNALTSYVGNVQKGERGASVMAGSLNDAAGAAASVFSKFGPLGNAAAFATRSFGKLAVAVAEQTDAQFNAYRGLQQFGAAAQDGLHGIQSGIRGLGLTVDQLESMVQMIGQQSVPLAMFQGTVYEARKELSAIGQVMENRNIREELMLLGMSSADVSEAMINFVSLQSEVGAAQRMDQSQLANATGTYLKEMNALTKATGIQRDAAEEQVRQMRQQERFRAYTDTLRAEGQEELAQKAEDATKTLAGLISPEAAKGLGDILAGGGALSSQDAIKLAMSTGMGQEGAQELAAEFNEGQMEYEDLVQRVLTSMGETGERLNEQGLANLGVLQETGVYLDYADMSKARVQAEQGLNESIRQAREERETQEDDPESGVRNLTTITRNQIKQSQAMSDIIESFTGVNAGLAELSEMAADAADALAGVAGAGTTGASSGGSGRQGVKEQPGQSQDTSSGSRGGSKRNQDTSSGSRGGSKRNQETSENQGLQSGMEMMSGLGAAVTPSEMRSRATDTADIQGISELVRSFNRKITSNEVSVEDLIVTPDGKAGDWASEIAEYMGIKKSQIIESSPENIGKLVMGLMGKQKTGKVTSGEQYRDEIRQFLKSEIGTSGEFRQGGIATGPRSGYLAELHGTEAIVPLSGGSIPVTISNLESKISGPIQQLAQRMDIAEDLIMNTANQQTETVQTRVDNPESTRRLAEQTGALREQISRLDRLIRVSESNNSIMSKILQNSYA